MPKSSTLPTAYRSTVLGFSIFAGVAACTRDSGGEHAATILRAVETLRLDADSVSLSEIDGFVVLSDGDLVAVPQRQDLHVAFVTTDGRKTVFGRRGGGPGEFQQLRGFGVVGDTLWVADNRLRRVSLILPQQELGRLIPYPSAIATGGDGQVLVGTGGSFSLAQIRGLQADGSILVQINPATADLWDPPKDAEWRGDPLIVRVDGKGVVQARVRLPFQRHCYVPYRGNDAGSAFVGSVPIPFCAVGRPEDVSPDGRVVVSLSEVAVDSDEGSYRLTAVGSTGDTLFSRRYDYAPIQIPRSVADSAIQARLGSRSLSPEQAAAIRSMRVPQSYPPLRGIVAGSDTTVWLERWTTDAERHFLVLDRRGVATASVQLSRNQRLVVGRTNEAWVVEEDSTGRQSIVRLRLETSQNR
jgi:hypothetical protein